VTVALHDFSGTIHPFRECPSTDNTRIGSEAHIASLGGEFFLMIHDMDDIVYSLRGELFTRGITHAENMTSKLDRHDLRPETDPEKWDFFCASIFDGLYHSLRSASPESSRDTDSIESIEETHSLFFDIFCLDESELDPPLVSKSSTLESLIE
jgi:hypothetical protein